MHQYKQTNHKFSSSIIINGVPDMETWYLFQVRIPEQTPLHKYLYRFRALLVPVPILSTE